ncbi:hypothetical protein DAEQUDRAFT_183602 [Daedalea quercina L-15889]|uniref:Uncharacterized protein n=1 Tax=Daedalea quercina L-15889 TaxID=1314783 RepID=A0A165RFP1_9APHY|nr:hypothetical protein DAEQUDRAFT_183602 [Daedalea quercina L-15889]
MLLAELTDWIIDYLWTDPPALLSCALTCTAWLPTSRLHLRRPTVLIIRRATMLRDIASVLCSTRKRRLFELVETLIIIDDPVKPFTRIFPICLHAEALPNLKKIIMEDVDWARPAQNPHHLFFRALSTFDRVHTVELQRCRFQHTTALIRTIHALPTLRPLYSCYCEPATSLSRCALTCKAWNRASLYHLRRFLSIRGILQLQRVAQALSSTSSRVDYARVETLYVWEHRGDPLFHVLPFCIYAPLLPNLTKVIIQDIDWPTCRVQPHRQFFLMLSWFKNVTSVEFNSCRFRHFTELLCIMRSFPRFKLANTLLRNHTCCHLDADCIVKRGYHITFKASPETGNGAMQLTIHTESLPGMPRRIVKVSRNMDYVPKTMNSRRHYTSSGWQRSRSEICVPKSFFATVDVKQNFTAYSYRTSSH